MDRWTRFSVLAFWGRIILFSIIVTQAFSYALGASRQSEYQKSLAELAQMVGLETDSNSLDIVDQYFRLPPHPELLSIEAQKLLIEGQAISRWSAQLNEYLDLLDILYSDLPAKEKKLQQKTFDRDKLSVRDLRVEINRYLLGIHPQFRFLEIDSLQKLYQGQGIQVAVFDVFDEELLIAQRQLYPKARIMPTQFHGNPVSLNHGNTVIDVLLTLMPALDIIPIAADSISYTEALRSINAQPQIDIVNMSRAFAQAKGKPTLEPHFAEQLKILVQNKILCKASGNTGTDFDGNLSPIRKAKNLGPVNNLFSYDINLIKEFFTQSDDQSNLTLLAINLDSFAEETALSATVPGAQTDIQQHSLAIPADAVWSPATQSFESGSSFAAPQLAALSALLLQSLKQHQPTLDSLQQKQAVVKALLQTAQLSAHGSLEWGQGIPSAERAINQLTRAE